MKLETLKKRFKGFPVIKTMQSPSRSGGDMSNQVVIAFDNGSVFSSYGTLIALEIREKDGMKTYLTDNWDYSVTTGKYRNQFLGEGIKETIKKIADGTYKIVK